MTLIQHLVSEYASQAPKPHAPKKNEFATAGTYACSKLLKSPKNTATKSTETW